MTEAVGWPPPETVRRYLEAASEGRRGRAEGRAVALVRYLAVAGEGLGPAYHLTLVHGGAIDTLLLVHRLERPAALWAALEEIAAACPRVPLPEVAGLPAQLARVARGTRGVRARDSAPTLLSSLPAREGSGGGDPSPAPALVQPLARAQAGDLVHRGVKHTGQKRMARAGPVGIKAHRDFVGRSVRGHEIDCGAVGSVEGVHRNAGHVGEARGERAAEIVSGVEHARSVPTERGAGNNARPFALFERAG